MLYESRQQAGQYLAEKLMHFKNGEDVVVLALPRGGVVLGAEVAHALQAPLGVVLVRKIGHPSDPEYAIGAIAENDSPIYDKYELHDIDKAWLKQAETDARQLIENRRKLYYGEGSGPPSCENKTVILVDDGIATGLTMRVAIQAIRKQKPKQIVVAVPVAPLDTTQNLQEYADQIIVLDKPENFRGSVGAHYEQFEQVDDEEVIRLLKEVRDE